MNEKKEEQSSFFETLKTLLWAGLIAILFRSFLFEPFSIPSGSMIPTLLVGDYLFVSKYSYGYSRYSFPLGVVPIPDRVMASSPQRGDVVVFRKPGNEQVDYIKRLIGLPGDRVQLRQGRLYINDMLMERQPLGTAVQENGLLRQSGTIYAEILPEGYRHLIQEFGDTDRMDNTAVFSVPQGHFFFMGDNRDNSRDSRAEVGMVPFKNLVGRAELIFFSHNGQARLWEIWRWPAAIRLSRIGKSIE